jgi:murein DD-endopeptidase MepM/ murein hydrolase activator NlpD
VEVGQPIMRSGNSGRSSGPHIHYDLHNRFRPGTPVGLPAPFVDVWVDGVWRESAEPARGQTIRVDAPKGALARKRRAFIDI